MLIDEDDVLRANLARNVCVEVAEELIRLRNFRGWSQQQVADAAGMPQSVIARHESARSNMTLNTVEKLLESMDAVIRIECIPQELMRLRSMNPRWWQVARDFDMTGELQLICKRFQTAAIPSLEEGKSREISNTGEWTIMKSTPTRLDGVPA